MKNLNAPQTNHIRQEMAADSHRPSYHFLPPANWINDPHGLIEVDGRYHLFYQYNPDGPFHGSIHWGHATSEDLVHWHDLPIALAPGPEAYDRDGCWTGCLVMDDMLPTIIYTAAFPQTIAGAVSYDGLLSWQKLDDNPLLDGPPEELRLLAGGHFRDPFIWKADDGWEMLAVSKIEGQGGQVVLFTSKDLRQWTYQGIFLAGDSRQYQPFWQGTMWECPNLLDYGAKQVLILSIQSTATDHLYAVYFTGKRVENRYEPAYSDLLVHGGSFYAPQIMRLSDDRLLMFGWLPEGRSQQACLEAGWNGTHSLPLVLDLLDDDIVSVTPAEELKTLRTSHWHINEIRLTGASKYILPDAVGKALEIQAQFTFYDNSEFGLRVLCSPDEEEQTSIVYQHDNKQILIVREYASLDQRADKNPATMPVHLKDGEPLRLQVFVDHSIIELFVNGRLCLACRVYPVRDDSQGVGFFSRRGRTKISNINIWKMSAIWPTYKGNQGKMGNKPTPRRSE
ncbi:MAG: glycoside hydrolase family 32 protein [Candidatus Promineifilaceae bacterium]|nr:glycoside hydrolase family 32 protein [Candidatus Promineifilaceae bacterium]